MRTAYAVILCVFLAVPAYAQHAHPEKWYQSRWCADMGGVMEVVMPSGSRCDCVTDTHAVEVEFIYKKWEAVTQALNYAAQANRRAGIVFIMEKAGDERHLEQVRIVRDYYGLPLDVWLVGREGEDLGRVD